MDTKTQDRDGTWDPGATNMQKNAVITYDKSGKPIRHPDTEQSGAAHEFGHAIGLHHVDDTSELEEQYRSGAKKLKKGQRDPQLDDHNEMAKNIGGKGARAAAEYGSTEEEQRNIMGKGMEVKKIGGADAFDPFTPFQKIAEKWGEEVLKAKNLNTWESSNM